MTNTVREASHSTLASETADLTLEQRVVAPRSGDRNREIRETDEAQTAIAAGTAVPDGVRSAGILVLSLLAGIYTLYFGREIILPIVLALVLKLLLAPAMRLLCVHLRFPNALAALTLILLVFGAIAGIGFAVSVPASGWIAKAPDSLPLLKEKLAILRQPLEFLQNGLKELENLTARSGPMRRAA